MSDLPITANIRQCLFDFFNDEELTTLCFDYFPVVHSDFAPDMAKGRKIQLLLEYCQRREIIPNLLAAIQRVRPEQYEKRFPQAARLEARPEPTRPVRDPKLVFISHTHQDADFAHRLANDLQQNGWRAWIAPDSIHPGEMWGEGIDRGMDESGVLVLVLTPRSVQSPWVRKETYVAIQLESQGRIKFIPLEVEPCDVPGLWSTYQRVSFQGDYGRGLTALLDTLEPVRRAQRERKAQEKAAREEAERLERELEERHKATQAEAERQARLAAEKAEAEKVRRERQARLERTLKNLRDPRWQGIGAIVAAAVLAVAVGVWLWPNIHAALFLHAGATRIAEKDGMVMVYVPTGAFLMGSADSDSYAASDEKPQHKVYLDAFWIDRTEVANAQYKKCVQAQKCRASPYANDSNFNGDNQPVVVVDWNDAKSYCEWAGRRLPTEAEWEKAARGTDGRLYPWGNTAPDSNRLNFDEQVGKTTEVGKYPTGASPYGALDMAGNLREWTSSLYKPYPYKADDGREDMSSSGARVLRGGSFYGNVSSTRATLRSLNMPSGEWGSSGFRCGVGGVVFPISLK